MAVHIVDAIPGAGKSTAMINFINSSPATEKFLYITPYLEEVQRIKENCPEKDFYEPVLTDEKKSTKTKDIRRMFKDSKNIVSTHSLFMKFNDITKDSFKDGEYILIMDEVANVVQPLEICKQDLQILTTLINVDDDGHVTWKDPEYNGLFNKYKYLCDSGCLTMYGNSFVLWMFPINIFKHFKDVYVLTYLFKAQIQRYYFDYHKIQYDYLYVCGNSLDTYFLTTENTNVHYNYLDLISVLDNQKMNAIGDDTYALSKTWYMKNKDEYDRLKKNTYNFFKNIMKSKTCYNVWTTFKCYKAKIAGRGYTKGFIPLNARATNKYRDTYCAAYLVNIYLNPGVKNFFTQQGIDVDEDGYALSELLQWLWRTRIRSGESVAVYIPSKRMRNLLINWINEIGGNRDVINK